MKVALIQMNAGPDKSLNLRRALFFVEKAVCSRAEWILFPELFTCRGNLSDKKEFQNISESLPALSLIPLVNAAKRHGIYILAGSIVEKSEQKSKAYNTSILIDPKGKYKAIYRKMNLFGARLNRDIVSEGSYFLPGKNPITSTVGDFRIGMSVCYDLRFASLYRTYLEKKVDVVVVPSAFTKFTGKDHWEVLLRARAIENQCFVLAPNQVGKDFRGIESYGHSMVIGPWGEVLARASENSEEIIFAKLDRRLLEKTKEILPGIR